MCLWRADTSLDVFQGWGSRGWMSGRIDVHMCECIVCACGGSQRVCVCLPTSVWWCYLCGHGCSHTHPLFLALLLSLSRSTLSLFLLSPSLSNDGVPPEAAACLQRKAELPPSVHVIAPRTPPHCALLSTPAYYNTPLQRPTQQHSQL